MAYGVEVSNSTGSKIVLDPTFRPTNLITCKISTTEATFVTLNSMQTSSNIDAPGLTATNTDKVWIYSYRPGISLPTGPNWTVNRFTDYFTITYNGLGNGIVIYFVVGRNNI